MSINEKLEKYYISIINNDENGITNKNEIYKNYPYPENKLYKFFTSLFPCDTLIVANKLINGLEINRTMITKDDLYQKTLDDFLNGTNNTKTLIFSKVFSELLSYNYINKTLFENKMNNTLFTFGSETYSFIQNVIEEIYNENNKLDITTEINFYYYDNTKGIEDFKTVGSLLNVQIIDENEISTSIFHCKNETKIYTGNKQSVFLYIVKSSNDKILNIIEYNKLLITKEEIEFYINKIKDCENISIVGCINQEEMNIQVIESLNLLVPNDENEQSERKETININNNDLATFGIRNKEDKKDKKNMITAGQLGLPEINEMEISSTSVNFNKKNNNDNLRENLELSKAENRIKELIEENTKLKEMLKKYENDFLEEKQEKLSLIEENSKLREKLKEQN